jgi:uncharacterized protein (DUF697 family)
MKKDSNHENPANANTDQQGTESIKGENADNNLSTDELLALKLKLSADNLIKNHVVAAMAIGFVPVPIFDVGLLVASQVKMVHGLCKLYQVPFSEGRVKSIILSLIGGSVPVFGTIGLSSGVKLVPGIGSLFGSGLVSTTGGATTYAVGQIFSKHFASGGTLVNLDRKNVRASFKKELDKGREAAKELEPESQDAAKAKAS